MTARRIGARAVLGVAVAAVLALGALVYGLRTPAALPSGPFAEGQSPRS